MKKTKKTKKPVLKKTNKAVVNKLGITSANPVTPTNARGRSFEGLLPGARSPERKENGNYCLGCDYHDFKNLIPCEANYFTPTRLAFDNHPIKCIDCKLLFGKGPKETHVRVNGLWTVMCCKNAVNHRDHLCLFALCYFCCTMRKEKREVAQNPVLAEADPTRPQRPRRQASLL